MCSDAPAPDPQIGQAAKANAEISKEAVQLGRDQFQYSKDQNAKYQPYFDQILNQSLSQGQKNIERSDQQWSQYQNIFMPNEAKVASDAATWDSQPNLDLRRGEAVQDFDTQFDLAKDAADRDLARSGADAGSGAGLALTLNNGRALGRAGAATAATSKTRAEAMGLRMSVANLGRGFPAAGLAAGAQANADNSAGVGAVGAGNTMYLNGVQTGIGAFQAGVGANNSAANILQQEWNGEAGVANAKNTGMGSVIGAGMGLAGAIFL